MRLLRGGHAVRRRGHVEDDVVVEGEDDLRSAGVVLHGADNHPLRFLHGDAGKADVAGIGVAQAVGVETVEFAGEGISLRLNKVIIHAKGVEGVAAEFFDLDLAHC